MKAARLFKKNAVYLLPAVMLVLALGLKLENPQFLRMLQLKVFDQYQQLKPREYQDAPVKIIDVDEDSLAKIGQFPWPRNKIAELLIKAFEAGAAVVAFDVVFAEPDRTSPRQILPVWLGQDRLDLAALPDEWRDFSEAIINAVPDHDEVFADVMSRTNVVAGYSLTNVGSRRFPLVKAGFAIAGDDPSLFIANYQRAASNLPILEKAAHGAGSFNLSPEADNIVRRVPLVVRAGEQKFPSLAAEALRVAQGARGYILKASGANMEEAFGEQTGLNHIKIGRFEVPVDESGSIWIHYTADRPERFVPAWKLFEPDFDKSLIEGHILFFGTSAAGLKDLRSTPLNPVAAGVEVHALAAEQIILNHFLERPDWADGAESLFILLVGGLMIILTPRIGALWTAVLGAVTVGGGLAGSWYGYSVQLMLFDPVYPAIAALFVYLSGSLLDFINTEAEKRQVRGAFSQYLSPALVEQLADEPERLQLGGEMKDMTFLFCDVRGFTAISETFKGDPQGLTKLINKFLTPMTNRILELNGTIDKYMGDCIMAFWNAPLDDPEHARHGCRAALDMFNVLDELNERLRQEAIEEGRKPVPLNIGIGLNTGECVVGNMGSEQRFDYSVLGDAVNLAARLEGQSKNYGVGTVIGDDTYKSVPEYAAVELDLIAVKGKIEAVTIHGLLGDETRQKSPEFQELLQNHNEMLRVYRDQDWDRAAALIKTCRDLSGDELTVLYDLYDERVEHYRENPPGEDWDGVFVATSK